MATQFHITAPDGSQYDVTGPDGATEQDALAQVQAQHSAVPAAPPHTSQALGFEQGVGNFMGNVADLAGKIPGVAPAFQALSGHSLGASTDNLRNPAHAPDEVPGKIGRFGADVLESAPLAALAPAGVLGTVAAGAGTGALTADPGHQTEGAVLGGGLGGVAHAVGKAIAPAIAPAVQRLRDAGAVLTPGQVFGGVTKGLEDRAAGFPLIGDFITGAQNRSLETANNGAFNTAVLAPVGQALPPGVAGHDAVRAAGGALSNNYNSLLPQMNTTLGAPFSQAVADASQRVSARLPDEMSGQFQGTLGDVFKKLNTESLQPSQYTGTGAHEAASDLSRMSRTYSGQGGNNSELGDAYGTVAQSMRDAMRTSNPQLGPQLAANDEAYANLVRLEGAAKNATGNASGKLPGVFTGQQLRTAARAGDTSVRDRATARGEALLQPYAEDMIQVLPSSVGDSGTAGRNALAGLLLGGAAHAIPAPAVAAGAVVPALYSKAGMDLFNRAYVHPAGPVQSTIGEIVQQLARYGAGPTGGLTTVGKQ